MNINKILAAFSIAAITLTITSCANIKNSENKNAAIKSKKRPNIVYILTDQWRGAALGYVGDVNVKTPNLDNFSNEAVNFTNSRNQLLIKCI